MKNRLVFFLLGLILGIGIFINREEVDIIYFSLINLGLFFIFKSKKEAGVFFLALILGLNLANIKFSSLHLGEETYKDLPVTILERKDSSTSPRKRYIVRAGGEKSVFFSESSFQVGDQVLLSGESHLANKNSNPNLFNFRNYLLSKGIKYELTPLSLKKYGRSSSIFLRFRNNFRKRVIGLFRGKMSEESANFAISVVLGENLLENDDLINLGLVHLLAVSGLHIDLLMSFISKILKRLGASYKARIAISIGLCLFYGYLIAFPYSVIRVLLMESLAFLAFLVKKPFDRQKSLMVSFALILVFNPFALLNSGCILSFVAVSGIYILAAKIKEKFAGGGLIESFSISLSVQLVLLPFLLYYNGRINLLSLLANLLVLPIFEMGANLIFINILLSFFFSGGVWIFLRLLDLVLTSLLEMTYTLAQVDFLTLYFRRPSILLVIYAYLLILYICLSKKGEMGLQKSFYLMSILLLSTSIVFEERDKVPSFSMIDIGQGDAFLIEDGGRYYMVDVGGPKFKGYDSGEKVLVPLLKSFGIKEIEAVFISHMDGDHAGNLDLLCQNFQVKTVISSKYYREDLKAYNFQAMKKGDFLRTPSGKITCVFGGIDDGEENNKSLGLLIDLDGCKILSLGDLESFYEDKIKVKADCLKVSHHGSRRSTDKTFVKEVKPKFALISAGRNNMYGHPTGEVLENLRGVQIYNSQETGFVSLSCQDGEIYPEKFLKGGFFK